MKKSKATRCSSAEPASLNSTTLAAGPHSLFLGVAAVGTAASLAAGLSEGNGMLHGHAAEWLVASLLFGLTGLVAPERHPTLEAVARRLVPIMWLAAFAYAFILWPVIRPALYLTRGQAVSPWTLPTCTGIAAVLAGYSVGAKARPAFFAAALAALSFFFLGLWLLNASPSPRTDVVVLHQHALAALSHGINPHSIHFPNIYPEISHYPPGLATATEVLFGYAYPAMNLIFLWPFYGLGDYRLGLFAAYLGSGIGLYFLGRHRWGAAALILCLFMPRALLILENGWTEPLSAFLLILFLLAVPNKPRTSAVLLGLFLASKQTMPLLVTAFLSAPRLCGWHARRYFGWTLSVVALVTLPFVLTGPRAYWHSVILVPLAHPFRFDAMTLTAWWHERGGAILPSSLGFGVLGAVAYLAWARLPKTRQGMAYGVGVTLLFFVAFNRQGFCNYYFLAIAAMAAAAALAPDDVAVEPSLAP